MGDTYTPIHNDVLDALMKENLSGGELRIILAIWRKTYGFTSKGKRKKFDYISVSQLVTTTGLQSRVVYRALKSLQEKKIVCRSGMRTGFCKDFMKLNVTKMSDDKNVRVTKMSLGVTKMSDTKETNTKETKESNILHILPKKEKISKKSVVGYEHNTQQENAQSPATSHSSLVPLTYPEIYAIASRKNVSLESVTRTHQQVLDSIADGNKYKTKSISRTVAKWLDRAIGLGDIQSMNEYERLIFQTRSPEEQQEMEEAKAKARRLGLL